MNLKELYQEIILDHGKNPRNLGKFDNFNKDAKGHNPLCGDKVHLFLKLDENKKVDDISFEGEGCAISMASASIMTDLMKGKSEKDAKEIISLAEKNNVTLAVGHIERHNVVVQHAKKCIDKGEWGEILSLSASRFSNYPARINDVGVLFDLTIHDIDAFIFDKPKLSIFSGLISIGYFEFFCK